MFMVGTVSGSNISFTPAGGVIKFNVTGIPTSAKGFKFISDDALISGKAAIMDASAAEKSLTVLKTGGSKNVTIDFSSSYASNMTFYIPVQDTTITGFSINLLDASNNVIYALHSAKALQITANKILVAPAIAVPDMSSTTSLSTAIGVGDGKLINVYNEYVVAVGKAGYIISDKPSSGTNLYCYTTSTSKPAVGDIVNVTGTLSNYNGFYEIKSPSHIVVSSGNTFSYPTSATDITSTFGTYSGLTNLTSEYIKFTGSFTVSGSYYNITVGTNTIKGSLSTANDYSMYDGKTVTVTGYYIGKTSTTYQNLVPTSISAAPFLDLPATSSSVAPAAGTFTFNVNSNTTWTAAAATGNTMGITNVSYDNAAGTVTVTYSANTTSTAKTGVINVTASGLGKTLSYTITQAGVGGSVTTTLSSFSAVSGNLDSNVSYASYKGGSSTNPAIYSNIIRLYQNGSYITITAASGYKLSSVSIGSAMATLISYKIDNGTETASETLAVSATPGAVIKTVSGISASSVTFICKGTTSSARLYVNYLSATYAAE